MFLGELFGDELNEWPQEVARRSDGVLLRRGPQGRRAHETHGQPLRHQNGTDLHIKFYLRQSRQVYVSLMLLFFFLVIWLAVVLAVVLVVVLAVVLAIAVV